jgi:hypothetical protein
MTDTSPPTTVTVPSASPRGTVQHRDDTSLSQAASRLRDAARAVRETSDAARGPEEAARAFALIEAALDDLAGAAEFVAYATMDGSRRRAFPPEGLPLTTARALSWRLHGLRRELVVARRICTELTGLLDSAVRR